MLNRAFFFVAPRCDGHGIARMARSRAANTRAARKSSLDFQRGAADGLNMLCLGDKSYKDLLPHRHRRARGTNSRSTSMASSDCIRKCSLSKIVGPQTAGIVEPRFARFSRSHFEAQDYMESGMASRVRATVGQPSAHAAGRHVLWRLSSSGRSCSHSARRSALLRWRMDRTSAWAIRTRAALKRCMRTRPTRG